MISAYWAAAVAAAMIQTAGVGGGVAMVCFVWFVVEASIWPL